MAKKIDLSGVKQFLFDKGEKIALAVCGLVAVLLLVLGVWTGLEAGKLDYKKDLENSANALLKRIKDSTYDPKPAPAVPIDWPGYDPTFLQSPYIPLPDPGDKKRRNPDILAVDNKFQMDFIRGGNQSYNFDTKKKTIDTLKGVKAGGGPAFPGAGKPDIGQGQPDKKTSAKTDGAFAKTLQPTPMIVVTGVFPMRRQLDEFSKALRISVAEIIAKKEDMPRPLSLNIYKREIKNGKETEWQPLYVFDADLVNKDDQIKVHPAIDEVLRRTFIDEDNPKSLKQHIMRGLVTPLPRLGNVAYPKIELPGIKDGNVVPAADAEPKDVDVEPKIGKFPGMDKKGPLFKLEVGGGEGTIEHTKWGNLKLGELEDRFLGKYFTFDPYASMEEKRAGAADAIPKTGLPGPPDMKDKDNFDPKMMDKGKPGENPKGGPATQADVKDLIVRFFDVNVEPGKTYQYSIQVRMANPNFEKKDLVASDGWADIKELPDAPFATTPTITIPGEYAFYAVDMQPELMPDGKGKFIPGPDKKWPTPPNQTGIQIHQWVSNVLADVGEPYQISDWVIAERVLVGRGEYIGRQGMMVEVPAWNPRRNGFEVGSAAPKKGAKNYGSGLPISFQLTNGPPMLIDFLGGRQKMVPPQGGIAIFDESAVEILILGADGTLTVRNARDDSDIEHPDGRERINRHTAFRDRLRQLRNQPAPGGGGVNMPGKGPMP